jgi:hypothetical protein
LSKDEKSFELYNAKQSKIQGLISEIPISQITGFIFGSFSTRFWMMRIGVNQQVVDFYNANGKDETKDGKLPFYAWQCISLQTKHRDFDLVIEDDF